MQEYLLNPITLICLGTIFILVSVLFLYFKRNLSVLEKAQMDQARILQSFIANMEMTSMMQHRMSETNIPHQMNEQHTTSQEELIEVSDDEGSSDESDSDDEDSDDEDSDDESDTQELEVIELSEQMNGISDKHIKVIQLESDNLEEVNSLKIDKLSESSDDDSDDDDDDDDDDDNDDNDDDDDLKQPLEYTETSSIAQQLNIIKPVTVDYKTMNVNALRELAEGSGLITQGEKRNKKDLIKLLEDSK